MKRIFFTFGFAILLPNCMERRPDVFVTQHNLSPVATFDFTKSYSATLGEIIFLNKGIRKKKWRFVHHAPVACLYNKKTKVCSKRMGMPLVSHNPYPRKLDSYILFLLDSATYHYPVKPYGSTRATVYLNLSFYPKPKEIRKYIFENHKDLKYYIFIRSGGEEYPDMSGTPDFIVETIKVVDCNNPEICPKRLRKTKKSGPR